MIQLEDSTLDLIYRRRVQSFLPGYVIIILIFGFAAALPLVNVDVVTNCRGMVRPFVEPAEVCAPISGILDNSILRNNINVKAGDTLVWIRKHLPEAKLKAHRKLIKQNMASIRDITLILKGKTPRETSLYKQSYKNHLATLSHLKLQNEYLYRAYSTAEKLYQEEVISQHEYETARSEFLIINAKLSDEIESYRDGLETEFYHLEKENTRLSDEIDLIQSTLYDYSIIAPVSGTLHNCQGFTSGSIIQSGSLLGTISPLGKLVAECYLDPESIPVVHVGTRVKLRFDNPQYGYHSTLETKVDYIEKDISFVNGSPLFRIRCSLDNPLIIHPDGSKDSICKGMTFTANMILFRCSLASLLLDKVNRWGNPAESVRGE